MPVLGAGTLSQIVRVDCDSKRPLEGGSCNPSDLGMRNLGKLLIGESAGERYYESPL